jgi:energy-coupling factor transporter ATP-binding protein EcfA2
MVETETDTETRTNPFPGLRSFEPEEDHLFFGREARIDELLTRLRRSRFLSVVGTSGSGKSSLIRSGLIPSLYSGLMTKAGSSWRVVLFRPGEDPIGHLATALNEPEAVGGEDPDETSRALLEVTLRRSAMGLVSTRTSSSSSTSSRSCSGSSAA